MAEAARITDDIGHVSTWARIARVVARAAISAAEVALAAGAVVLVSALLLSNPIGWCAAAMIGGTLVGIGHGIFPEYGAWKEEQIQDRTEDIGDP